MVALAGGKSAHTSAIRVRAQVRAAYTFQFGWLAVILWRALSSGGFVQTLTVSGFVEAAARIAREHGALFKHGPRFVRCLRHTAVHNPRLVRTPGYGAPFPVITRAGAAQPDRYAPQILLRHPGFR